MKLNDFVGFYNNIKCHVIILFRIFVHISNKSIRMV